MNHPDPTMAPAGRLRFGAFEFDRAGEALYRRGRRVPVQDMPLKVLDVLLEHPGQLVRREEFFQRLWPDDHTGVLDDNLNVSVWKLRAALGDTADHPRYIETEPRKGYRFVSPVEAVVAEGTDPPEAGADGPPAGPGRGRTAAAMGILAVLVVVLAFVAGTNWWPERAPSGAAAETAPEFSTVAVLPFANLSGNPDNEYFSDGITEQLLTSLSRVPDFRVISRSSIMRYKHTELSAREIAAELGATHLLEGSVQRVDDRVRITAQLIDARADYHLWAEHFDRQLQDIFAIQTEIATVVTRELQAALPGNEDKLVVQPTEDVEAYELYLRGQFLFGNYYQLSGTDSIIRSLDYYQQALERDPEFAQAWAALGSAYALAMLLPDAAGRIDDPAARTRAAVERALALEPDNAMAHSALAAMHMARMEWADAERSLVRANEADMQLANSRIRYGYLLVCMGRSEEALDVLLEAAALDPVNAIATHWLADAYRNLGQMEESLVHARRTVDLAPTAGMEIGVYLYHLLAGDFEQAMAFQESISVDRGIDPAWVRPLVEAVRDPERIPAAVETLAPIAEAHSTLYPIHYYFDLDDPELIFDTVDEMAADTPFLFFLWRFWEPQLAHLRNHPRFHVLAERIGMLDYWREMGWPDLCRPAGDGFVCD